MAPSRGSPADDIDQRERSQCDYQEVLGAHPNEHDLEDSEQRSHCDYREVSDEHLYEHDLEGSENTRTSCQTLPDSPREARLRRRAHSFHSCQIDEGQNITVRSVLLGLAIGVLICFSNMYFGLQTGWINGMSMPAALIGFAFFKSIARHVDYPFTPVENVLVQTVAGAVGTMPLGCGFVGVMPALNYLLRPEDNGPLILGMDKLVIWSLGICFFGVFFAVPLRRVVIIREKLKFPSGTATALMIEVLHGDKVHSKDIGLEIQDGLFPRSVSRDSSQCSDISDDAENKPDHLKGEEYGNDHRNAWKAKIRVLVLAFVISAVYTVISYFIPQAHNIPLLGLPLARRWMWTLNPSPAYIGQGIIMGSATTLHMLLGAAIGWGILSPLAKYQGWAPGPVEDWSTGSKGWIVWVSLAIMLADSIVSLGWLVLRPLILHGPRYFKDSRDRLRRGAILNILHFRSFKTADYTPLESAEPTNHLGSSDAHFPQLRMTRSFGRAPSESQDVKDNDISDADAPSEHLVSNQVVMVGFVLSIIFCIAAVRIVFGSLVPIYATIVAVILALLLSVMGIRALGETDLNPVSGISKLTQLFFALIVPASNKNSVIINLLAGAISESGAMQAGDMMQDLKTGHMLGAAPKAQFYGQLIGSLVGAIVSAAVYQLYTSVYEIPGGMFQVPTAYVWLFTARLVTGQGLPHMAWQWALGAGVLFALATGARVAAQGKSWQAWIPGGIAVAVGMYNVPSFTLARTIGGLVNWYWRSCRRREETPLIVLASGLILGEGVMSIINLLLASFKVPHL